MSDRTLAGHHDTDYHRQVDRLVEHYRRLADDIERRGHAVTVRRINGADDRPVYSDAVYAVVAEIRAADGNTPLDQLLRAATDADLFGRTHPDE